MGRPDYQNRRNKKRAPKVKTPRLTGAELDGLQLRRLGIVGGLLSICFVSVLGTCAYLQGCEHDAFRKEAEKNYLRRLRLDTQRGELFDRNGERLAASVEVPTIYVNPRMLRSRAADIAVLESWLAENLKLEHDFVRKQLGSNAHFRYLKRQVTHQEAKLVRDLVKEQKLEGIYVTSEAKRFYPKRELAGQVLGVVGFDSTGHEGLERAYDKQLRGNKLTARYHRNSHGQYAMVEALGRVEPEEGRSLQLTLDENIQTIAEEELERTVVSSMALSGVAVVMDVRTGDLLAVAHYPRFNPNNYREIIRQDDDDEAMFRAVKSQLMADLREMPEDEDRISALQKLKPSIQRRRNRAVADIFEPGSTFKIFTLAAALEERIVRLDDEIDTEGGRYKVGKKWISDTHRADKPQSVRDLAKFSSNVGFIKIGQMLGRDRLHAYLRNFGFGSPSGYGGTSDSPGVLRPPRDWPDITLANISFGQGVAVTAIQLTAATAAIGNRGVLMRPRIVSSLLDSEGKVVERVPPTPIRRVVSEETATQVIDALSGVVEPDGTGARAWMYDYNVAGKTGTAQKPDFLGGYAENRWIASFVGLAPAERPTLCVLVAVDEPQGLYYGGRVAAPAFKSIAERSLNYLDVPPSYGARQRVAREEISPQLGEPDSTAEGAYYDWPADGQPGVDPNRPAEVAMPDFSDLGIRGAVGLAHKRYLTIEVDGTGTAAGQSIRPGTLVPAWTTVDVFFRPAQESGDPISKVTP
jgi:cell division protein FtsI (penicillin-binding protein 3)